MSKGSWNMCDLHNSSTPIEYTNYMNVPLCKTNIDGIYAYLRINNSTNICKDGVLEEDYENIIL